MSLLKDLRSERDYWLVPVHDADKAETPDGTPDYCVRVLKGANEPWMEWALQNGEADMAEALGAPELAKVLRPKGEPPECPHNAWIAPLAMPGLQKP